jgi:signal transduction histidine kinase
MKKKLIRLSQRYESALAKSLKQGPQASLQPAQQLGCQAVAIGVDTLELARIHEQALATFELSNVKNGFTKLAGIFFAEANARIVATQSDTQRSKVRLSRLQDTLGQRTDELSAANRQLQRGVVRCKVLEQAAEEKGKNHRKNLEESLQLQKRLRQLTHRVMLAQEDDRKKISRELQDEIAQTLLGINVRLLSLKRQSHGNTKKFNNEIASTQLLVAKSARSVRQAAREIGHQE